MNNGFNGFTPEMPDFLFGLQFENTVQNKDINLQKYKELVFYPLCELYDELKPVAEAVGDFDTKQSRSVSSPYTDRRFTDKPIKEYCYLRFKQMRKNDSIGLYFDMGCEYYSFGLRIYKQTSHGMNIIREKLLINPEKSAYILEKLLSCGYTVKGASFKQDHFPEIENTALHGLLNMKVFYITKEIPINKKVFTKELSNELKTGFSEFKDFIDIIS